jgi:hypothetical protein
MLAMPREPASRIGASAMSDDADRAARAAAWRLDQAERQAICASLDWQGCIRALVAAKRMSPDLAGHMGVAL